MPRQYTAEQLAGRAKWRAANKERIRAYGKQYRKSEHGKRVLKANSIKNREKISLTKKLYRQKNLLKSRADFAKWKRFKRKTDPEYRVKDYLRSRMYIVLKRVLAGKSDTTMSLAGCSIKELILHLEKMFKPGMNWQNHGLYGWHIDHIRPCDSFDLTDPEQQKICFHYSNLQPLWAKENWAKNKYYK